MICCKIVTDFNNKAGNFCQLCESLAKLGDCLYENGYFYFGDTTNIKTSEKTVSKILKKNGYTKFYISVYDKANQPQESDEAINGWLTDKLIRINYNLYERESQELFHNISKGLDILDEEINVIRTNKDQEKNEEEE